MTIERITYNRMCCDHAGCPATRKVWEGCDWQGWVARIEGRPWTRASGGGWREAHYCPDHAAAHPARARQGDPAECYCHGRGRCGVCFAADMKPGAR